MEILNKIGILDNKRPFVASIGSAASVGKTVMSIVIASELVNEGKNVLFIGEDSVSNILRKASKFLSNSKKCGKFVVIGKFFDMDRLEHIMGGRDFDYLFFDTYIYNDKKNMLDVIGYVRDKKINTFFSVQLKRVIEPITENDLASVSIMQKVDYAYVLTRKEKLSFFEKVKYWLKCCKVPNFNLNLIKNRYGKEKKFDFHIDFNKLQ